MKETTDEVAFSLKESELAEAAYWHKLYQPNPVLRTYQEKIAGAFACALPEIDILAFNRVIGLGTGTPVTAQDITHVIHFYRMAGAKRFFVQLNPDAFHLHELLLTKGFRYYNNWAKLAMPVPVLSSRVSAADPALTIRPVAAHEALTYGKLIVQAFEWPEILTGFFAASVGLPGYTHYFALANQHPVAAAALHINGRYASMAMAGTLPQFRGRGAQTALLTHRLREAHRAGCSFLVTETGEDLPERPNQSFRNMLKTGFQQVYLRRNYVFEIE